MISVLDLFTIGIGPSSSHTVGPMKAAYMCLSAHKAVVMDRVSRIRVDLYGSLALTGKGHGTDTAIVLGLMGESPEDVPVDAVDSMIATVRGSGTLMLLGQKVVAFSWEDIHFNKRKTLAEHPNGMTISGFHMNGDCLFEETYFSVGGGFVVAQSDFDQFGLTVPTTLPYSFSSARDLLDCCERHHSTIWELIEENEKKWHSETDLMAGVQRIWTTMQQCVQAGCAAEGILPGGLNVKRRAKTLVDALEQTGSDHPSCVFDWVSVWALAVNEENAAGGRVVTAPTNGAAGIIPAILHYYDRYHEPLTPSLIRRFFLTATAIGILYKLNASISGAEMGCQGEIGVASSMAAAGLTELLGGTPQHIECAAEIAMEHHLGLTCDPVKGLVQIPCIERNTMGAIKAINASKLALHSDGDQKVSLDKVIRTMKQTGDDMKTKYKETSQGGLAINVVEC